MADDFRFVVPAGFSGLFPDVSAQAAGKKIGPMPLNALKRYLETRAKTLEKQSIVEFLGCQRTDAAQELGSEVCHAVQGAV